MMRCLSALACLTALAVVACAADDEAPKERKFDVDKIFQKLDTNADGKLSKEEFLKLAELGKGKLTEGKSKDGEARIKQLLERLFERLDTNKDGFISREEFQKVAEMRARFVGKDKKKPDE